MPSFYTLFSTTALQCNERHFLFIGWGTARYSFGYFNAFSLAAQFIIELHFNNGFANR